MSITFGDNTNENETRPKSLKTIFLLGAGASRPAGIPTINEMTDEFLEHPLGSKEDKQILYLENEKAYKRKFELLSKLAKSHFGKSDLEYIMSVLISIEDNNEVGQLLSSNYGGTLSHLYRLIENGRMSRTYVYDRKKLLKDLREKLEYFVRKKCESITDVDYLRPFVTLTEDRPLEIFTLNYDATIEIFCENKGIDYTDGVNPYWDENDFSGNHEVNLYKLHGSLYWLRTKFGKILKVPIKGLKITDVKYLTDEPVSEMMIYPAIEKNKQLDAYSWLSQKFRDKLKKAELCVIIGYSFRDSDIKNHITESLSINQNLWLVLVDPSATKIKENVFSLTDDISARIVAIDADIENAVTNRSLHSKLSSLENARRTEDATRRAQDRTQTRLDHDWNFIIRNYLEAGHDARVRMIVEDLSRHTYDRISGSFPDTVEGILCAKSLEYMIGYWKKDKNKFELWKKIFIDSCTVYEHIFFKKQRSETFKINNPIKKDDFPSWYDEHSSISYIDMQRLKENFEEILPKSSFVKHYSLPQLIRSCDVLDERIPLEDGGGYTQPTDEEKLDKYKKEELGIRKYALKIAKELEF